MFGIVNYSSFIIAILVFQAIPGAGTITILNATAKRGIRVGLASVMGTLLGDLCMMLAAVLGLAALLKTYAAALTLLQWLGAIYLMWMGWGFLKQKAMASNADIFEQRSLSYYCRQGWLVSMTNPKVILFFVSFFPLFLNQSSTSFTLMAMIAHVTLISLVYQMLLVLLGNQVAKRMSGMPMARLFVTRIAGVALVGLGVKLALANK